MNNLTTGKIQLFGKNVDITVKHGVEVTISMLKTTIFEMRKANGFDFNLFMRQLKACVLGVHGNMRVVNFIDNQGDSMEVVMLDMDKKRAMGEVLAYSKASTGSSSDF